MKSLRYIAETAAIDDAQATAGPSGTAAAERPAACDAADGPASSNVAPSGLEWGRTGGGRATTY
eukprot:5896219-Prymnesium_polylepis.1